MKVEVSAAAAVLTAVLTDEFHFANHVFLRLGIYWDIALRINPPACNNNFFPMIQPEAVIL